MAAPKRTRIDLLSSNPSFRAALAAILDKFKTPYDGKNYREVFAAPLTMQAGFAVLPPRRFDPDRTKGTGKTWEALLRFPARLRDFAEEIDALSRGPWFDPRSWVMDDSAKEAEFVRLSRVMTDFAAYVEERARQIQPYSGLRYKGKVSPATDDLMEMVKHYTGQYCDQEVCNLLNAAASAMGSKAEFDLQTLMDRRQLKKPRPRT